MKSIDRGKCNLKVDKDSIRCRVLQMKQAWRVIEAQVL